eukprot:UN03246
MSLSSLAIVNVFSLLVLKFLYGVMFEGFHRQNSVITYLVIFLGVIDLVINTSRWVNSRNMSNKNSNPIEFMVEEKFDDPISGNKLI